MIHLISGQQKHIGWLAALLVEWDLSLQTVPLGCFLSVTSVPDVQTGVLQDAQGASGQELDHFTEMDIGIQTVKAGPHPHQVCTMDQTWTDLILCSRPHTK